jgi:hypothetical protein
MRQSMVVLIVEIFVDPLWISSLRQGVSIVSVWLIWLWGCGWQLEQKILSAGGSLPYPEEDY